MGPGNEMTFPRRVGRFSFRVNDKDRGMFEKKNAYALKTPHVVFLPVICLSFFFGRSIDKSQGSQKSMERPNELF